MVKSAAADNADLYFLTQTNVSSLFHVFDETKQSRQRAIWIFYLLSNGFGVLVDSARREGGHVPSDASLNPPIHKHPEKGDGELPSNALRQIFR
jgi:hypothetical protein